MNLNNLPEKMELNGTEYSRNYIMDRIQTVDEEIKNLSFTKKLSRFIKAVSLASTSYSFRIDEIGGGSYTDGYNIVIAVPFYALPFNIEQIYSFCIALSMHELEHVLSTDNEIVRYYMENTYDKVFKDSNISRQILDQVIHHIFNAIEDGRIERRAANRTPGKAVCLKYLRRVHWYNQKCTELTGDNIEGKELSNILWAVCSLATFGVYPRNWRKHYADDSEETKLLQKCRKYIDKAVASDECSVCVSQCEKVCSILKDYIIKRVPNISDEDIQKMLEQIKSSMQNDGNNQSSAQEDGNSVGNSITIRVDSPSDDPSDNPMQSDSLNDSSEFGDEENDNGNSFGGASSNDSDNDEDSNIGNNEDKSSDGSSNGNKNEDSKKENSKDEGESNSGKSKDDDSNDKASKIKKTNGNKSKGDSSKESKDSKKSKKNSKNKELNKTNDFGEDSKGEQEPNAQDTSNQKGDNSKKQDATLEELIKVLEGQAIDEAKRELYREVREKKVVEDVRYIPDSESLKKLGEISGWEYNYICKEIHENHKVTSSVDEAARILYKNLKPIFLPNKPTYSKNRRKGLLDVNNLTKLAVKDRNIFMRKNNLNKPDIAICLLIDRSGSMSGLNWIQATDAASLIELGIKDLAPLKIMTFNTFGWSDATLIEVVKDFKDTQHRGYMAGYVKKHGPTGCNRDGLAIRLATQELMQRREKTKILIVISDGEPSDYNPKYENGIEDVHYAVHEANQQNIKTFGIYIENCGESFARYKYMYGDKKSIFCDPVELSTILPRIIKNNL